MTMRRPHHLDTLAARQRGIATVLILLLVGLALTAAVLATAHHIQGQQQQDVTTHAQTQAQLKAWTGAELVRQYLEQLQANGHLDTLREQLLPLELTLTGTNVTDTVLARITAVGSAPDNTLTAQITGIAALDSRAEARAMLEVVYAPGAGSTPPPTAPRPTVLNYNRNLTLGGSIKIEKDAGDDTPYEIRVLGDIVTLGNSITGVDRLLSTGSIHIGSGSAFAELHANCDVKLTGSVTAARVLARRNACFTGSARATEKIRANGSVETAASQPKIAAGAQPQGPDACAAPAPQNDTTVPTCWLPEPPAPPAPRPFHGVYLRGGSAGAIDIETAGDIYLTGSGTISKLLAQGDLFVPGSGKVTQGTVGGQLLEVKAWNTNNVQVTTQTGLTVALPAVPLVSIATETFNANDYRASANYAFTVDANGYRKVTVRQVQGLADGEYFLGDYTGGGYKDYLCTQVSGAVASPTCTAPATPAATATLCQGYSAWNGCFTHGPDGWKINGQSMAPGVAWFAGNLEVANGSYFNTFIATGNIKTSGSHITYAPNYVGYDGQQTTTSGASVTLPQGVCKHSAFPQLQPAQFCTPPDTYTALDVGNYAFMAGSRADEDWPNLHSYQGGDITLGASSRVYGNVKAGNQFISGGSTTIHGYASALALGVSVRNSMGGSTTFDLRNLPASFTPGSPGTLPEEEGGISGSYGTMQMQWSRYR